ARRPVDAVIQGARTEHRCHADGEDRGPDTRADAMAVLDQGDGEPDRHDEGHLVEDSSQSRLDGARACRCRGHVRAEPRYCRSMAPVEPLTRPGESRPVGLPYSVQRVASVLRPYRLHLFLLGYSVLLLWADGRFPTHRAQLLLGAITFGVLCVCVRSAPVARRPEIWVCVPVAALFEVFGSLVWGGYTYRFHNIPAYVPPGHALVYVFGITAASLPFARAHERRVGHVVLAICTGWTVAGLTVLPLWTHRVDASGALIWPLFAWCILRSGRPTLFAGIWLETA